MTLREKQSQFALNLASLILELDCLGYQVTIKEVLRTYDQQWLYVHGKRINKWGKLIDAPVRSKTFNSAHLNGLAADLYLFKDNKYLAPEKSNHAHYEIMGSIWKALHPQNIAGIIDWNWDYPHLERR